MESKENDHNSKDESKSVGSETSGGAVINENSAKEIVQETEEVKNGVNKIPIEDDKKNGSAFNKNATGEKKSDEINKEIIKTKNGQNSEEIRNAKLDDLKSNEVKEKNEVVVIQRPKRTKSRKSLKKMPSINSIDIDINGNPGIYRTDR